MSHHPSPERAAYDLEKKDDGETPLPEAAEVSSTSRWSSWFGGRNVVVGPRIGPVLSSISIADSDSEQSSAAILDKQLAAEDGHAIQYRTCSWQKFIQGLHVLVGAKYLNTMTASDDVGCRTVTFSIVVAIICWLCSLPRTFDMLSKLGTASAFFTFVSVLLATIFAAIQSNPAGYTPETGDPIVSAVPVAGTTFVNGLGAFLNISYTFIGQITLPSFIAEMRDPRDFPKALWACTIAEIILFSIVGGIVYAYVGTQYVTAPAFGSLQPLFKKVSFSFMIPTIIFLGVLYASVSARFIFFRIFQNSRHKNEHTLVGWATWTGILLATWILAFIIAEVIPFFSSLLSLMSSLFDSFFGFIFWGVAYFRMRRADGTVSLVGERTVSGYLLGALNLVIILIGIFFLTVGTYASVESIILEFESGAVGGVFSCASNGL
ncbi:hypothetical protein NEMBOFW57_006705 [Staphylotrichum longicolle]|uniref:Amino acid transporter transmembrane domain-containing protein n=1 Tax=Staphylotrichum longicolle TaxID=669026 RepID=A0AAD4ETS0_9PEZI|nr:hypothetical protein NEMBOFW57_006705 [Staphylotrichum longicolle]